MSLNECKYVSVTLYYRINGSSWETSSMILYTSNIYQALLVLKLNPSDFLNIILKQ